MPGQNTLFIILPIACLLAFSGFLSAQIEELGSPIITNYEPLQYQAHAQNWVAIQDRRGVMYFGNTAGILQFDGQQWNLIPVRDNAITRALACGPDGTIYYGSLGDFGYLETSSSGKTVAISLADSIPPNDRKFNDVWQALSNRDGIYFLSQEKVFRLIGGKVHPIAAKSTTAWGCLLGDTLFFTDRERGVCMLEGDEVVPFPALSKVFDKTRITMAPFGSHELLVGRVSGDFLRIDLSFFWDKSNQRYDVSRPAPKDVVNAFPSELAPFLPADRGYLYKLFPLDAQTFAISTIKGGIVVFDRSGNVTRVINANRGLLDNTVTGLFVDRAGDLWALSNSGISHIEFRPVQSYFGARNGIQGVPISACTHKGRMYIGTYQNTFVSAPYRFSVEDDKLAFTELKNGPNEAWQFLEAEGDLLVASSLGLQKVEGEEAFRIPGPPANAYCLGRSRRWPGHIFVGLVGGLEVYRRKTSGWEWLGRVAGVDENVRSLSEDGNGDLWAGTDAKGLLCLHFAGRDPVKAIVHRFGPDQGLPGFHDERASCHGSTVYVVSPEGLYSAAVPTGDAASPGGIRFALDASLGRSFLDPARTVDSMVFDQEGGCFFSTSQGICRISPTANGRYRIETRPFCGAPKANNAIGLFPDGSLWIPGKTLFRVNPKAHKDYDVPFAVLVTRVTVNSKRSVFEGNHGRPGLAFATRRTVFVSDQSAQDVPEIPFRENALAFEFSATVFAKPGTTQFQFLLEGFEKEWSEWSERTGKEYTNLPEGKYRFRVRARDVYGTLGQEAAFSLRILPPWYRTWWAYVLWVLSGAALLAGVVHFYTLKLRRQKAHLERIVAERTQQLRDASLTDPLTGLRNRRFIMDVLKSDISAYIGHRKHALKASDSRDPSAENKVFGLFVLDIDFFKKVNDTYGHDAGDRVLKQFADILTSSVRTDDVVMRTGGEEFLVVLKKTRPEYLPVFASKVLSKVASAPFDLGNGTILRKTCSIGFVSFPVYPKQPDLLTFEQSMMVADLGMYVAKQQGRNQGVCLAEGRHAPDNEENLQKMATTLEFALEEGYLQVGACVPGPKAD